MQRKTWLKEKHLESRFKITELYSSHAHAGCAVKGKRGNAYHRSCKQKKTFTVKKDRAVHCVQPNFWLWYVFLKPFPWKSFKTLTHQKRWSACDLFQLSSWKMPVVNNKKKYNASRGRKRIFGNWKGLDQTNVDQLNQQWFFYWCNIAVQDPENLTVIFMTF